MTDINSDPHHKSHKGAGSAPEAIDFSDIPTAWPTDSEPVKSDSLGTPRTPSIAAPNADSNLPPSSGGNTNQNTGAGVVGNTVPEQPFTDDDLGAVDPATNEQINTPVKKSGSSDLNEDFDSFAKAATQDEIALKKRMFELQQKLHSINLDGKKRLWIWANPFIEDVVDVMSDHLGIPKGDVIESAILMFYRNCFSFEKGMLADMGLMLDSATLQNQELAIEASALEDLANLAMQAEASPLNQEPPEH